MAPSGSASLPLFDASWLRSGGDCPVAPDRGLGVSTRTFFDMHPAETTNPMAATETRQPTENLMATFSLLT